MATFEDFAQLDIRVGRIVDVKDFPQARRPAYRLWIDFGPLGVKTSSAQIVTYYRPEDLLGRQVVAVTNFPPKQVANFRSEVLVLGVYDQTGGVVLLRPDRDVDLGDRIG